jgi:hypothetical protein
MSHYLPLLRGDFYAGTVVTPLPKGKNDNGIGQSAGENLNIRFLYRD